MAAFALMHFTAYPNEKAVRDSVDIYLQQNKYFKGLSYARKQSTKALREKNYLALSRSVAKEAEIYTILNDNGKAFKILFEALETVQQGKEKTGEILLLNTIGGIFTRSSQYEKAKKYYYSALTKARKIHHDSLICRLYQPLFNIHYNTDNDSALYYLKKTNACSKEAGTSAFLTTAHTNYFAYYNKKKQFDLAKAHLDSSIYYARKSNSPHKLSVALTNLAAYQVMFDENYHAAKQTYKEIFALTPNDTVSDQAAILYYNYSGVLENLHEYNLANVYLNKYIDIRNEIFSEETSKAIRDVEMKYQVTKIEEGYLRRQKEMEATQSKNKKIFLVFIALLVFTLILFYFFYQNSKLKQKNKLKDIESQIQQNIINATIDGQENERKKIASVLHDNISALLSSAGLQLSAFVAGHPEPSEEIAKTRSILKETHDKVRDLSHELLPTLLAKFGLFYALQDLCEKNSNSVIQFKYSSKVSKRKRFHEDYEMKAYFIITELLNNVIKHSGANEATLIIDEMDNLLWISVTDNGQGFDTTKSRTNEGFGLTQIRARVTNMGGKITMKSRIGEGATITIKLPLEN